MNIDQLPNDLLKTLDGKESVVRTYEKELRELIQSAKCDPLLLEQWREALLSSWEEEQ